MKFEVLHAANLPETISILEQDSNVRIVAGGTDLLVRIKQGFLKPNRLLSLNKINSLKTISYSPGQGLRIGALVTHAQTAAAPVIKEKYVALTMACSSVGTPQIRNLGTVVGNIVNASPAADTAPALLALNAEVVIHGRDQVRQIALADFFVGSGQTVLNKGELISEIIIPEPSEGTLSTYYKVGRRKALEISICSVAMAARPEGNVWFNPKLVLGAVAPTPGVSIKASAILDGQLWLDAVVRKAASVAISECSPIDDQRASAQYRRQMVEVSVRRAIKQLEKRKEVG
ncbi:xanthine dehydrogenase family protein subunit M [Paradesulfitobacterium aromaticivorans]